MANALKNLNIEENAEKATAILRKGFLAYVGMNGMAFEAAKVRIEEARKSFDEARKSTDGLYERFVKKGEEIEAQAGETLQDVRARVQGWSANDRTVEIKVQTKATKAPVAKKTTAKKTTTKKTAAKKPTAKKTVRKTVKKAA